MATVYWDPFQNLEVVRREMERVFDQYDPVRRVFGRGLLSGATSRVYPLINLAEDKDNCYVEALVPGVDPESIEVSVLRDQLRIAGTKTAINPDIKPEAFHRNERGAGTFTRMLTLPTEIDGDQVKADYKNGVLMLTLPKHAAAKPKQIAVSVA
jgi:HSP20 family protein